MSIRTKIFASFGAIMFLVAISGTVAWNGLSGFVREVEGTGAVSALVDGLDGVSLQVTRFRSGQETEDALANAGTDLAGLAETAQALSDSADSDESRAALISVADAIKRYQIALSSFLEQETRKRSEEGEMLARIGHFEASVVSLSTAATLIYGDLQTKLLSAQTDQVKSADGARLAADLSRSMLKARYYEAAYRISNKANDAENANKMVREMFLHAVRLKKATAQTKQEQAVVRLAGSVNGYREALSDLMKPGGANAEAVANLTRMSTRTSAYAGAIEKALRQTAEDITTETASISGQFEIVINARIAAMQLVGLVRKVQISQIDYIRNGGGEEVQSEVTAPLKKVFLVGLKMKKAFNGTEHADTVVTLIDLTKDYRKAFAAYVEAVGAQTAALATMQAEAVAATHLLKNMEQGRLLDMNQSASISKTVTAVTAIATIIIGGIVAFLIGGGLSRPIASMTNVMSRLAENDFDVDVPGADRTDEIGRMSQAVQFFRKGLMRNQEMGEAQRKEEEEKEKIRVAIQKVTEKFDSDARAVINSVETASGSMKDAAQGMAETAHHASERVTSVASGTAQAAASVETIAAAAQELTASVQEIARQVTRSTDMASGAVSEAEHANTKVQGLVEATRKIGEVVALITDIADQTNLLALNATIEAARAGEAGKGFAVVASEVKNLANQTARATQEIGGQIQGIQTATEESVVAIQGITNTIGQISEVAAMIAAAVEEQSAATEEIARNAQEASTGTQNVSEDLTVVSEATTQTGTSADKVLHATEDLTDNANALRDQVVTFIQNLSDAQSGKN